MHVDWKSETAIRYNCMYLKSPKGSKRILSSLTRDVVIAFRMTAKLFSFKKDVPNRWIIMRNGTTKLGLFPDQLALYYLEPQVCYSLIMINLILQFRPKKDVMVDCY